MLRLDNKNYSNKFNFAVWLLMAFQAGYVNVGGFYTAGSFVSHVTGTSSQIGRGLAKFDPILLITFVTVLLSFIIGAAFSGHNIGVRTEQGKSPRYVLVAGTKFFFFGLVLLLSYNDIVHFINLSVDQINILIVFLLSFCCGVQNSTCSQATGGFLKPTHMTGLSTDLGIGIAKWFGGACSADDMSKTLKRISLLIFFIFGGAISTLIFEYNGHLGFLFPFISSAIFLGISVLENDKEVGPENIYIKISKAGLILTFITTLFFGVSAYANFAN